MSVKYYVNVTNTQVRHPLLHSVTHVNITVLTLINTVSQ